MAYQKPLHYLLGLEGAALLRAYAGEHDRAFAEARVAEIRRLLDDPAVAVDGVTAEAVDTVAGYRVWASTYDDPGNGLFAYEEPFVHAVVGGLPAGTALDAACGTGRHAAWLAARGHRVIAVDSSPDMLARACVRVPEANLRAGDLVHLPVPDAAADLVLCALALAHLPDLVAVVAARPGARCRSRRRGRHPRGRPLALQDGRHVTMTNPPGAGRSARPSGWRRPDRAPPGSACRRRR